MIGIHDYPVFVSAAVLLNLTPGPDTVYIIGRSMAQGQRSGVISVLGISTGVLFHTCAVAFGLSAIVVTSAMAFTVIKYVGAAYLVYLGVTILLNHPSQTQRRTTAILPETNWTIYRRGMLTNVLNPKVALFFLALLPQFVDANSPYPTLSFILLGLTFVTTGTIWCLLLVRLSSGIGQYFRQNQRTAAILQRITGTLFIGLGVKLAVTDR